MCAVAFVTSNTSPILQPGKSEFQVVIRICLTQPDSKLTWNSDCAWEVHLVRITLGFVWSNGDVIHNSMEALWTNSVRNLFSLGAWGGGLAPHFESVPGTFLCLNQTEEGSGTDSTFQPETTPNRRPPPSLLPLSVE